MVCTVFGHRQSENAPPGVPGVVSTMPTREVNLKEAARGLKGSGKGGKGNGLYEVGWSGDFYAQAGWGRLF